MSATLAGAVSLKRLLPLVVLACVAASVLVSAAPAGGIADQPCPDAAGENTKTCPPGTEGVPYSIKFLLGDGVGCAPGDDTWHIINGTAPPGLSLSTDGTLSGTPTQAGTYKFWIEMRLPDYWLPEEGRGCNGSADTTQEELTLVINPGIPKLTIGPESAPVGTVSTPYSLQMTASVADPKTWSILDGSLPPGLAIGASDGLISGTPSTPGTYSFTVQAAVNADQRSDTKALGIVVRAPLAIARRSVPKSEVGVRFVLPLAVTGGSSTYTWSLTGALPTGVTFTNGTIAGIPEVSGTFPFTVSVLDTEGRTTRGDGVLTVAERLEILAQTFRPAKVGRFYQARVRTTGGVLPATWRIKRGPLPRGVSFDRRRGVFLGTPKRARTYRIGVEIRDALGVKATTIVVLVVQPAAKPKPTK
jgi:hypothetical protein